MAKAAVNIWALKNFKPLTEETVLAIMDELEAGIAGATKQHVFSSSSDAYALASRFKNVLYRYPFFKKKHVKILRAIVDRCGEAYYKKEPMKLYISKNVVEEWSYSFQIPLDKIQDYLFPMLRLGIFKRSDRPDYVYKINDNFFQLIGPVAQYLVMPIDTKRFAEMMAVASGIASVYVIATSIKSNKYMEGGPLIPWFLKLPMIYTLSGLESGTTGIRIKDVLELERINAVDSYFVTEKNIPVEWWRSIRAEAFEFMADNNIIEQAVPNGYRQTTVWVRMHEEGVKRYIKRLRERYERRYRGY